jgi:hypothetical protein
MTTECDSTISRLTKPEVCTNVCPSMIEGAGNAGCTLHPRSRVQNCAKKRTRAYRFSGNTPASPAQWLYGLCRDLLGDEFLLSPSLSARSPIRSGWIVSATDSLTPATGVGTTRFCRTPQRRSSCALLFTHGKPPCEHTRADAAASTASSPAFRDDRDTPLLQGKDGQADSADLPDALSGIFFATGLDRFY